MKTEPKKTGAFLCTGVRFVSREIKYVDTGKKVSEKSDGNLYERQDCFKVNVSFISRGSTEHLSDWDVMEKLRLLLDIIKFE